jgi:hypothetical protein
MMIGIKLRTASFEREKTIPETTISKELPHQDTSLYTGMFTHYK